MSPYQKPELELADVFEKFGHLLPKMPKDHYKVINAIKNCRTGVLGGHLYNCGSCDFEKPVYNSCRNRHCPKCGFTARQKWIESRTQDLLPCQYFHVVFTLPSELRPLILRNKKVCYDILFKASSDTLKEVAKNPDRLGVDIGFVGVLHTWSQKLIDHPHTHFIVPGGGLNKDGRWIKCKKDYLLPVEILSTVFRGKIIEYLEIAYDKNKLKFMGDIEHLVHPGIFRDLLINCSAKSFKVDSRKPFSGPKAVIRYLGQYTHRTAISNHRLIKLEGEMVHFKYRDPDDPSKKKTMVLQAKEFMRRFLLHVLPKGFVRIRHFGLLASRSKKIKVSMVRKLYGVQEKLTKKLKETWEDLLKRALGIDPDKCPGCDNGRLIKSMRYTTLLNTG